MTAIRYYSIEYMGNVLDEADTHFAAQEIRLSLVDDIMANRLPDFLTADDFDGREDCLRLIEVVERWEDQ